MVPAHILLQFIIRLVLNVVYNSLPFISIHIYSVHFSSHCSYFNAEIFPTYNLYCSDVLIKYPSSVGERYPSLAMSISLEHCFYFTFHQQSLFHKNLFMTTFTRCDGSIWGRRSWSACGKSMICTHMACPMIFMKCVSQQHSSLENINHHHLFDLLN
jgi:hypothetical protein